MSAISSGVLNVYWRDATRRRPQRSGKYVVEVECPGEMCYLSTRSYNATSGWMGMNPGERVSYWLDNLTSVTECRAMGLL